MSTRLETKLARMRKHNHVVDATGYMFTVGGKPFRCQCSANVFHKVWDIHYGELIVCNACQTEYQGE